MEKVYLETSVVSYLVALRSRDLIVAARQQLTIDWWEKNARSTSFMSLTRYLMKHEQAIRAKLPSDLLSLLAYPPYLLHLKQSG